jgi:AcrR family transcriptional regulator
MADAPALSQQEVATGSDAVAPGTTRPGGRTARTRAAVLRATVAELATAGYDQLSLDAVAGRAGVHKTTVYRRWGDRERLVADALKALAAGRIQIPDTGDVDVDLHLLAGSVVETLASPEGAATVRAMVAGAQRSQIVHGIVTTFWAERTEQAGAIVRRAVERGQLPAGTSPAAVIRQLGAPLYHQLLVTLEPLDSGSAERAAAAAVAAARAGVFVQTAPGTDRS